MRTAQPSAFGIVTMLIPEHTVQHQNFFATPVAVRIKTRVGRPSHQCHMFSTKLVQRHDLKSWYQPLMPGLCQRVDDNPLQILRIKLMQFYKNDCTFRTSPWRMTAAGRIAHIGASRVAALGVVEFTFEHQKLLTTTVTVFAERGARRITYQTGSTCHFIADTVQHLAFNAGSRRGDPLHLTGIKRHSLGKIIMNAEHVVNFVCSLEWSAGIPVGRRSHHPVHAAADLYKVSASIRR